MKYVRNFALINAAGDRWELDGTDGIYAVDPSGLGISLSPVMGDVGQGFFAVLSRRAEPQLPCGFSVVFTRRDQAYDQYHALARWIARAGAGLLLAYAPIRGTEYLRSVSLSRITKTELTETGWLRCPTELRPLTPWYLPTPTDVPVIDHSELAMRFDYLMDSARYDVRGASAYAAVLSPAGDIPAAIRFTYTGALTSPILTLTGEETGTVYGRCAIDADFAATDTLDFFSGYLTGHVHKISASGVVTNLADDLDPTNNNFFRLPLTEDCALSLSLEGAAGTASAEVDYYYRSV